MKKMILLTFFAAAIRYCTFAQTTNTFPATGNVGIGTTTPATKLHVVGGEIRLGGAGTSGVASGAFITFYDSNNTTRYGFLGDASAGNSDIYVNADAGNSLRFGTNGVNDRMVINTSGNVGIGTTTPVTLLNVAVPSPKATAAGNVVSFLSTNDATNAFGLRTMIYGGASIGNRYATLQTTDYSLIDGGSLILQPSTGNVGIGNTTPNSKLDISGNTLVRGSGTYAYNNPGVGELQIGYGLAAANTAGTVTRLAIQPYGHTGGPWKFDARDSSGKAFLDIYYGGTGSGSGITVNNTGNVSIGTLDSKGYKFAVNGSAIATSMVVKLNANWPDYVFKKNYPLLSLTEVKAYIDQNQHLPDMPSEQEVVKDGINLGEMNKLLTKKVEELTLYMIEQEKIQKQQQDKIDHLEEAIRQLLKNK